MEEMNECGCYVSPKTIIAISDYKNNELVVSRILVCDSCKKWYDSLRLSLTEDQIKKYFG